MRYSPEQNVRIMLGDQGKKAFSKQGKAELSKQG
jgi:hypothetical protein